jgi:hypothetical protein
MRYSRAMRWFMLAGLVAAGACLDEERADISSPTTQEEAAAGVKVSSMTAAAGERITVAVDVSSGTEVYAVQGMLRFDPSRLSYLGQLPDHNAIVIVNESQVAQGRVRLASFSPAAMDSRVAKFAFEIRSPSYTSGLGFDVEVVGNARQERMRASPIAEVALDTDLPVANSPVRWNHEQWALFWDPSIKESDEPTSIAGLPPVGTVYGNVRTDALSPGINVLDASDIGNTSVGNREIIIGTDATFGGVDRVTTGNVRPLASGNCTVPGFDNAACTSRTINVLDAQAISLESVGTDVAVVGDAIVLPKAVFAVGDTMFVAGQTVTGTMTFTRDKLWILQGTLILGRDTAATGLPVAAGELVVESGTTVEGEGQSAIYVTRNGRLIADGTATQPITFTCRGAKVPACWGGVFIAGNAVVNEQDANEPRTAPAIPNRNPTGGQKQRRGEGGAVNYGGGNDADSSGVIRYVRFMYGGRILSSNNELNNLTIGACGSKTVLSHIQVHGGTDDGLEFFGGRCSVKYLYATANDDDQFDYSFGYDGNVQFVLLQHTRVAVDAGDKGFEVDNTETTATYNALPRVNPQVYNVTSVGGTFIRPGDPTATPPVPPDTVGTEHVHYRRGAGGTIRNVILIGGERAFIIDNNETCPANSGLSWNNVAILPVGPTTFTELTGSAVCNPSVIGAAKVNTAYAGQLKDPFHTRLPDFRPLGSGIAGLAAATPPSNGFFDTGATFVGAVAPVDFTGFLGTIAWYLGWTLPWQGPTTL